MPVEDDNGGIRGILHQATVGVDFVGVVHLEGVEAAGAQGGVGVAGAGEHLIVVK